MHILLLSEEEYIRELVPSLIRSLFLHTKSMAEIKVCFFIEVDKKRILWAWIIIVARLSLTKLKSHLKWIKTKLTSCGVSNMQTKILHLLLGFYLKRTTKILILFNNFDLHFCLNKYQSKQVFQNHLLLWSPNLHTRWILSGSMAPLIVSKDCTFSFLIVNRQTVSTASNSRGFKSSKCLPW